MALRTMQSREPSREDTARVVRLRTAGASVRRLFVVRRSSRVVCRVSFVVRRRVTLASNRARLFVSPFSFSQKRLRSNVVVARTSKNVTRRRTTSEHVTSHSFLIE